VVTAPLDRATELYFRGDLVKLDVRNVHRDGHSSMAVRTDLLIQIRGPLKKLSLLHGKCKVETDEWKRCRIGVAYVDRKRNRGGIGRDLS
jgi:hypothetical protein